MTMPTRLLICDDHPLFRTGIKAVLSHAEGIEVVGEVGDGRSAVEEALRLRPDVVLMDMELPELSGLDATRRIHDAEPGIRVLVLTLYGEDELVARCLEAGASGYVLKDVPPDQLLFAIQAVRQGGRYLSPGPLATVVDGWVHGGGRPRTRYDLLTAREREVLKLLAEGHSVKAVAVRLGVGIKTIDAHKTRLMSKLDVHDRAELIRYALQNHLIRLPVLE
jgi:two-component system response regulator NreC